MKLKSCSSWFPFVQKCLGEEIQALSCLHEVHSMYALFAIKACLKDKRGKEQIVRHLPIEISHLTKYLLDRGTR